MDPKCKLLLTAVFDVLKDGYTDEDWAWLLEELEYDHGADDWRVEAVLAVIEDNYI